MRSAIIAAAFVASALAVPYEKRDVVTNVEYDVVYVTDVVTVTNDGSKAEVTPQAKAHHGHKHHGNGGGWGGWSPWSSADSTAEASPTPYTPAQSPTARAPSPSPSPTQSSGGSGGSGGSPPAPQGTGYSDIAVYHHNIHRANHSAPDIQWDDGLAKSAADIAATCVYAHNTQMDGGGYGQNIAAGVEPGNISAIITNLFYNGEVGYFDGLYGQSNPDMSNFESWGHFSQIVWKASTHFACATQDCSGRGLANVGSNVQPYFTVCNYKTPGNFGGEYAENIGEPLGQPTADWNAGM